MLKLVVALVLTSALAASWIIVRDPPEITEPAENSSPITPTQKLLIGDDNAAVSVVEYVDYKCPNCNQFHQEVLPEIRSNYGDQIAFEVRMFPTLGPDSGRAARGAYCAADQNAFANYHEKVLQHMWMNYYVLGNYAAEIEDILTSELLSELIRTDAENPAEFKACLASDRKNQLIDRDLERAADNGVNGTPGFTINGQTFVGRQPYAVFETLLDLSL